MLSIASYRTQHNQLTNVTGGKNVYQCIDAMVLVSENACAKDLARLVGWDNLTAYLIANGLQQTILNENQLLTTARDSSLLLSKLQRNVLLNKTHTAHLLDLMKQQKFREGMPSGAAGMVVANKVGFIDNYWHDTGIIYGKKGTYVVTILTQNASAAHVANLTSKIVQNLER